MSICGIWREELEPIFCYDCGSRIGWVEDCGVIDERFFCDECAKEG